MIITNTVELEDEVRVDIGLIVSSARKQKSFAFSEYLKFLKNQRKSIFRCSGLYKYEQAGLQK
jgi:hypothetical protein